MATLPQTSTPALPSLLAALAPAQAVGTGEGGAFEQLVAQQAPSAAVVTAPVLSAVPAAGAPAPLAVVDAPSAQPTPVVAAPGKPARPIAAEPELADADETSGEVPAPTADARPATDKAVVAANELLATLAHFTAAAPKPAIAKPVAGAKGESETGEEAEAVTDAAPVATMLPAQPAVETRAAAKPAVETAPVAPRRDETPTLPMAAPKARDAAPVPVAASAAEPQAVRPAAEPSMTVLFAQPATQAGAVAEAAKPAVIAERVLDLTSDDAWIEQLASDIAATKSAANEVSFRLMPRHLGRLDVSMMMGDDGVSLKLDTQHEATATIVTAAQVRLVDDLRQQGVRVAETQVTHTPTDAGRQSQQGQGRSPAQDAAHLIETATAHDAPPETRDQERGGDRRSRFA
ncbi:hypothetical protein ASD67_16175 [Sphingopyxis sp. Root1497]|uniref:flagellar hook-length control protein FliK n=1 Tax=Sphingopyxis sp. Root1497 TaxID=1736474 RepID=UPI000714D226|nr:flagellar hook-length control protein FliK [Sphingopyxis sp. Root1497]KQZ60838.1 hypothetical protein ASD67_16175 [Sphingopyxis sp. Root1497]